MDFSYTYLPKLKKIKSWQNPLYWGIALIGGETEDYTITPEGVCDTEKLQEYLLSMELIRDQADPEHIRVEIVKEEEGYVLVDDTANLLDVDITVEAIEDAVDNIAGGTGSDGRDAHEEATGNIGAAVNAHNVVDEQSHGDDTEPGENELAAKLKSEGHAIVLNEIEAEPIGYDQFLTIVETGLNPYFHNLVD